MSRNLLKRGYTCVVEEEKRIIDTNTLMQKRIQEISTQLRQSENRGFQEGFVAGLPAENVSVLLEDGEGSEGNVLKANEDAGFILEQARQEAASLLEEAQAQAAGVLQNARNQAQQEKQRVLEDAKREGYEEGKQRAMQEGAKLQKEFDERKRGLEKEYQKLADHLEPQFIETITGIYEHIFHVDLQSYRDTLVYLIGTTMRKAEGTRNFIIHVSKDDYPYVSLQKKQLTPSEASGSSSMEIIEDITVNKGECLIETDGGIFDCGLGTQMAELRKKLILLSYENR